MKRKFFIAITGISLISSGIMAQGEEKTQILKNEQRITDIESSLKKFKITGYVQGQWQWTENDAAPAFGAGGSFQNNSNNRFGIRRGRLKFSYTTDNFQAVIQPDFTEKGVAIKDVYFSLSTNSKVLSGKVGLFDRPFGYEISYSSSQRESPERSRLFLSLFPGERDEGVMITLKGKDRLTGFSLDAGIFNGNGIGVESDSYKDFIGRLSWLKQIKKVQLGAAVSYYRGSIANPLNNNYIYKSDIGFVENDVEKQSAEKRQYIGFAAQYIQESSIGKTSLKAEYISGQQPGTFETNAQPGGKSLGTGNSALYLRKFSGFYAMLVQDLGQSKHSLVAKYDYYDPNTEISSSNIGHLSNTGVADVAYQTIGLGYLFKLNSNVRLMGYYDIVNNERCHHLTEYESNINQNILTVRTQIKF